MDGFFPLACLAMDGDFPPCLHLFLFFFFFFLTYWVLVATLSLDEEEKRGEDTISEERKGSALV